MTFNGGTSSGGTPTESPDGDQTAGTPPAGDWATGLVDRFVDGVDAVRRATTRPVLTLARGLVYGVVVVACVIAALVLASVGLFRLLDLVLPGESWSAHLVLGATCCALGGFLWSRRGN